MLSPFFACAFSIAKMRSCLRMRFAPSISIAFAMSSSSETCLAFSSDRCMARASGEGGRVDRGKTRGTPGYRAGARPGCASALLRLARAGARRARRSRRKPRGPRRGCQGTASEIAVEEGRQLRFRQRPDLLGVRLAVLVQDHRRNAADAELGWGG